MTVFVLGLSVAAGAMALGGFLIGGVYGRHKLLREQDAAMRERVRLMMHEIFGNTRDGEALPYVLPANPLHKRCIRVASIDELIARSKHVEEA